MNESMGVQSSRVPGHRRNGSCGLSVYSIVGLASAWADLSGKENARGALHDGPERQRMASSLCRHAQDHRSARPPAGYANRPIVDCQTRWLSRTQTRWPSGSEGTLARLPTTSRSNGYVGTPSPTQYLWVMISLEGAGMRAPSLPLHRSDIPVFFSHSDQHDATSTA